MSESGGTEPEGGREGGPTCPLFVGQSFWGLHKQPRLLWPQGVWQVGSKGDQATPIHHLMGGREEREGGQGGEWSGGEGREGKGRREGRRGGRKGEEGREGERGGEVRGKRREGGRNIK